VAFVPLTRPLRLADQVVEAIRARIESGSLAPGSRLPSEVALAGTLGVSRPVLREGLARLRAEGFLSSRRGSGLTVAARPGTSTYSVVDAGTSQRRKKLGDLFELRSIVEVSAAELAAARRTASDLDRLRTAFAAVQAAIDGGVDGADADADFHAAVARASGNAELARLVAVLSNAFADTRRPSWTPAGLAAGKPLAAQIAHRRILGAIEDGDVAAAGQAARAHLAGTAARTGLATHAIADNGGDAQP